MMIKRLSLFSASLFACVLSTGCATYQSKVEPARAALKSGDYSKATSLLLPLAEKEDGDQLVHLLDYSVALQMSGDLKESNRILLKSDRLADQSDYHSVTNIAGSLIGSQDVVQYKGDTFEKIFINAYLAMNFLEANDLENAAVQARRMNEKYLLYRSEEKKAFELNSFGKYLSAIIWEADKEYDNAYISYNDAYKIDPTITGIQKDLIRSSKLARRNDEHANWKKKFPEVKDDSTWYDKKNGEIIVIFQQGWGPRKVMGGGDNILPRLSKVYSTTQSARVTIDAGANYSYTEKVYDVSDAAIRTLLEDQGILLAKRLAGVATKAVLADQIRQKDQLAGDLAYILMRVTERPDLRQWSTLPESIQVVRFYVKPGTYNLRIEGLTSSSTPTGEQKTFESVSIKAQEKKFLVWRSVQ